MFFSSDLMFPFFWSTDLISLFLQPMDLFFFILILIVLISTVILVDQ